VAFDDFGGLDLSSAADATGGALDALNVDLDRPGRVRSRDGYLKVTAAAGATRYDSIFPLAGPTSVSSVTHFAGTGADDAAIGTVAWANPGNITANDGNYATATLTNAVSHYLKATSFGFAIPTSATINGIAVTVRRNTANSLVFDSSVRLLKAGVLTGNEGSSRANWPIGTSDPAYGAASDLWGATWTPADINGATFGVEFAALTGIGAGTVVANVDSIQVTVYYTPAGNTLVAGASGSRLDAIAADGTVAATLATASDTQSDYAAFGSPTVNATYIANSGATIRKLVGTTFSQPSGMPKAKFVGLQTPDNRLVAANIATIPTGSGATASTSLVVFSDPGFPEVWNGTSGGLAANANQYAYLTPGDNEDIQGIASWRNLTFVFKSSKFFVFYGNGSDSTGLPVFNYRQVTGAGLAAPLATAVAPDGVYFLDRRGIYFTNGGPPVRVSDPVDALFVGGVSPYFQGGTVNPSAFAQASMAWFSGRLYIGLALGSSATNDHTLVFDPRGNQWLLWDIPMGAMAATLSQPATLLFTYATGTNDIGQWAPNAYTTDAGTAITARYRSSFIPFDWRGRNLRSGIHGVEKIVRESMVDGSGVVSYTLSGGWVQPASLPTGRTLTLGSAPQVAQARDRTAVKARAFSWQISGTAPWSVEKVTLALHGYMEAGLSEGAP
jgi:hypothetical protein